MVVNLGLKGRSLEDTRLLRLGNLDRSAIIFAVHQLFYIVLRVPCLLVSENTSLLDLVTKLSLLML